MERRRRRIDRIADPGFLDDVASIDDDGLRSRRRMCSEVEHELSYQRRLIHARIDLIDAERRRRSGEETRALVEALPEALGDGDAAAAHVTAATRDDSAPTIAGRRHVDRILDDGRLAHLDSLDDDALAAAAAEAAAAEGELSRQRRTVHAAIDALDDELARRYREGHASVDDLFAV